MDDVWVGVVDPAPTLVVPATTWRDFPSLWPVLLGEVWGCQRASGINSGAPNVMFYLDDTPTVEVRVAQAASARPGRRVGGREPCAR